MTSLSISFPSKQAWFVLTKLLSCLMQNFIRFFWVVRHTQYQRVPQKWRRLWKDMTKQGVSQVTNQVMGINYKNQGFLNASYFSLNNAILPWVLLSNSLQKLSQTKKVAKVLVSLCKTSKEQQTAHCLFRNLVCEQTANAQSQHSKGRATSERGLSVCQALWHFPLLDFILGKSKDSFERLSRCEASGELFPSPAFKCLRRWWESTKPGSVPWTKCSPCTGRTNKGCFVKLVLVQSQPL